MYYLRQNKEHCEAYEGQWRRSWADKRVIQNLQRLSVCLTSHIKARVDITDTCKTTFPLAKKMGKISDHT